MKKVAIESPLNGDFARNIRYARLCALDCIRCGESPYSRHLFFTQFLNDATPEEREAGIVAGFEWADVADTRVFYTDLGWSSGMLRGRARCNEIGQLWHTRSLPPDLMATLDDPEAVDALATEGVLDSSVSNVNRETQFNRGYRHGLKTVLAHVDGEIRRLDMSTQEAADFAGIGGGK